MNIIVSKHAIIRYRDRCKKTSRSRAERAIKRIVKNNKILPYFNEYTMYCISKLENVALILTTNQNGIIVVKTAFRIEQFEQQKIRIEALINETDVITDVNFLMAYDQYVGIKDISMLMKVRENDITPRKT